MLCTLLDWFTRDQNSGKTRSVRSLFSLFSDKTAFESVVSGANSKLDLNVGDVALAKNAQSPGRTLMKTTSGLIDSGGELIQAPFKWLKNVQENFLIYLICAVVICVSVIYSYCMVRRFLLGGLLSSICFSSRSTHVDSTMNHNMHPLRRVRRPLSRSRRLGRAIAHYQAIEGISR